MEIPMSREELRYRIDYDYELGQDPRVVFVKTNRSLAVSNIMADSREDV